MADGRAGWGAGLIFVGLGAAVFTGAGVAAADTDASDGAGSSSSSSRSAENGSSPSSSESRAQSASAAEGANTSTDPGTDSSFTKRSGAESPVADVSGARNSRVKTNRVFTLQREVTADDSTAEVDAAATAETTEASSDRGDRSAVATTSNKRSAAPAPPTSADPAADEPPAVAVAIADEPEVSAAAAVESVTPSQQKSSAAAPAAVVTESVASSASASDLVEPETTATPARFAVTPLVADVNAATIQTSAVPATNPRSPGPVATAVLNLLSAFGWSARPEAVEAFPALTPWASTTSAPAAAVAATLPLAAPTTAGPDTVTGVKTGHAKLTIPVGPHGYTTHADWYFPTQADGSVSATGVMWLQHGFLNKKSFVSALAATLSQQTNSIVVAPNVASFPLACAGCWLNGVPMQEAVASMFLGDRAALNMSATAAGYQGVLPEDFVLSGQSAGGGFATAVGGYYATDPGNDASLRGVVMFDGFSFGGVVPEALAKLDDPYIPVYQVAAPPQLWNFFGVTTNELVAARPGEFVGATLAGGSHVDSLLGGNPIIDFFAQLVTKFSPPGNTAATHTLATGWINDMYQGLGPTDGNGIYGAPDQYIVMGDTAAIVLAPPPVVDVNDYLGTWYEVGSVKQFFSIGLVNTTAVYSLNPDGSIKVENSGNYFFDNGPESTIVGSALPVDPSNNKLNVSFLFPATANPPGNYWIVDLSPDYSELDPNGWAIVSDPTGFSGFLLSRTPIVSDRLYQELLDRASVKGVRGWITPTRQYVSATDVSETGVATGLRNTVAT